MFNCRLFYLYRFTLIHNLFIRKFSKIGYSPIVKKKLNCPEIRLNANRLKFKTKKKKDFRIGKKREINWTSDTHSCFNGLFLLFLTTTKLPIKNVFYFRNASKNSCLKHNECYFFHFFLHTKAGVSEKNDKFLHKIRRNFSFLDTPSINFSFAEISFPFDEKKFPFIPNFQRTIKQRSKKILFHRFGRRQNTVIFSFVKI